MSSINQLHRLKESGAYAVDSDHEILNPKNRFIRVTIDVTDEDTGGGAGAMTVTIQAVDPASGKKTTLLASASLAAAATTVLQVGPGLPVTTNVSANAALPSKLSINVNHTNANPMIYSVGAELCG